MTTFGTAFPADMAQDKQEPYDHPTSEGDDRDEEVQDMVRRVLLRHHVLLAVRAITTACLYSHYIRPSLYLDINRNHEDRSCSFHILKKVSRSESNRSRSFKPNPTLASKKA